jgi:hypothetical protein
MDKVQKLSHSDFFVLFGKELMFQNIPKSTQQKNVNLKNDIGSITAGALT